MFTEILQDNNFKALMNMMPASIFIKDANSNFIYMNQACEQAWKIRFTEVMGTDGGHVFPAHQQTYFLEADKKVFKDRQKVEFEEWVWSEALQQNRLYITTKVPTYDSLGQPHYLIAITQDITERKRSELRILRLTHLYQALSEINQAIVRLSDEQQLFPLICRCAVEFGGMQMAWVSKLKEASDDLVVIEHYGDHANCLLDKSFSVDINLLEGLGPTGTAMRESRAIIVNDAASDPNLAFWLKDKPKDNKFHSVGAFPISRGGKPFAVLSIYQNEINAFDQEVIDLFTEMAADAGFCLDNFDREAQRKLNQASQRLAALVYETTSEAMMVTDADNLIVAVNHAFTEMTGYLEPEVVEQSGTILKSSKHDVKFYESMEYRIHLSGKWHGELWIKRKSGETLPCRLTLNTVYSDDGSVKYRFFLFTDISQQKHDEEMILRQGNVDALTGLANRRMFHQYLEQEIKKSQRSSLPLVLMFLDLDNFKEVNDTLGHAMGDLLLKQASERLKLCVREFDSIARLGGDEFTVILSEVDNLKGADRVIDAILTAIAEPFQLKDKQAFVSASIGVTLYPNDAADADTLLKNADQAMYAAKNAGRNQFSYFTKSMQEIAQKRMRMALDLRGAVHGGQIGLAYQPILDLKSGHIVKAEALARWTHPALGVICPSEFIPIAEHAGLIVDIGQWIFEQVISQVKRWQKLYRPDFQVSINKSPVQIHNKTNRYAAWGQQLAQAGLSGKSIVVEITEGLLLDANSIVTNRLLEYRDAGIQVALDDFGTGYSSLSYLKKFDIDYIKIDRSFVSHLAPKSDDLALCEAMILMAHKLGIKVIAEGIETEEQQQLLASAGCDFGQGFLFSEGLPPDEFEGLLVKSAGLISSGWQ